MKVRVLAVLLALLAAPAARAATLFSQDPASPIGPRFWGSLETPGAGGPWATCGSVLSGTDVVEVGLKQSPVDIVKAVDAALPALTFTYAPAPFEVENNGHTIEVVFPPGSFVKIGPDRYELQQFHVHTPSEHTVSGSSSALELHLVHKNAFGDLAVVGVLFDTGLPPNKLIEDVIFAAPMGPGVNAIEGRTIDATAFLPAKKTHWAYSGSLTTPPCTEGVRWTVLDTKLGISQAAIDHLEAIVALFPGYGGYRQNNRPVRDLHGRGLFHSK
jgi:carbonic anhydrase